MRDNDRFLLIRLRAIVHSVLGSQRDDQLCQPFQHICPRVFIKALATSISRQIDGNQMGGVLKTWRANDVTPYGPAVREPVDKDDQRLVGFQCCFGARSFVADEVEFEAAW